MINWDQILLNKRAETNKERLEAKGLHICPHCESSFYLTAFYQKFCSKECKNEAYYTKKNGLSCIICSKDLVGRQKQVCSSLCRGKLSKTAQTGRKSPQERNQRISKTMTGVKKSPATISNMIRAQRSKTHNLSYRVFNNKTTEIPMKSILVNLGYEEKSGFIHQYHPKNAEITGIVDFYIPSLNLIIEVDGNFWHCNPKKYPKDYFHPVLKKYSYEIWNKDKSRDEEVIKLGYKVLRFWEGEFDQNIVQESLASI